jgi:hypothetical protein
MLARLKAEALSERSAVLVRKFFPVAVRLMETSPDLAPWVQWHASAMLDAALLAEEHSLIARILERINSTPSLGGRFATWLLTELSSARIWLQLVERLHRGPPSDVDSLEKWVSALGPRATPRVLRAIDALEPGVAQDVLCRALALMMGDPTPVITRLDEPVPRNVVALAFVLELCPAALERKKVFARLLARRDPSFVADLMAGRARAKGPETLQQLEVGLGNRAPEIRLRVLQVMAQLELPEVATRLLPLTNEAEFDARPDAERAAIWTAIANARSPSALTAMTTMFATKPSLLSRKKVAQQRRTMVEGLSKATRDEPRALLQTIANDESQPEEIRLAAQAGLTRPPSTNERLTPDQAVRLRRLVVLDLCSLVRAATATDISGGLLEEPLVRFREALRVLVMHEGKVDLGVATDGVTLNGSPVPLLLGAENVAPEVAKLMSACDLRSFRLDGAVQVSELRATLAQLCDPDGSTERGPHVQVTTFSGRVLQPLTPAPPLADAPARAVALYSSAVNLLKQQRQVVDGGKLPAVTAAVRLVDEWVLAWRSGGARLLAVTSAPIGERFAIHAVNTACIATAFGVDLQLDLSTLRELTELSLFWTLGEEGLSVDAKRLVGDAAPEDVRLRLGLIFVSQFKHRRGSSAAVSAFEVGLDRPLSAKVRGAGIVPSIVAMAEAWDALALENGRGHAAALEVLRSSFSLRFQEEMFGHFVKWVEAQLV